MSDIPLTPHAAAGLERLNRVLPLAARQAALTPSLRHLHRTVLQGFFESGSPPEPEVLAALPGVGDPVAAQRELADLDLLVLAPDGATITGAYPFTTEARVHRVTVNGHVVHAMCALDALSVAPMFGAATRVESACHVSGETIVVEQQGDALFAARPVPPVLGIRWQSTSGCAAQSLCLEMVFLRDCGMAERWQREDPANINTYALDEAVAFGAAFFRPLLA